MVRSGAYLGPQADFDRTRCRDLGGFSENFGQILADDAKMKNDLSKIAVLILWPANPHAEPFR